MGYIYIITNKINNYTYIGQTRNSLEHRFKQHCKRSNDDNNYFHNAIKKYGKENFIIELIREVADEDLDVEEIKEIQYRKSIGQAQYNIAAGGYNSPFKYKTKAERSAIAKKSADTMSKWSDEKKKEYKNKLSRCNKGENNGMYGKHHTEETRQKLKDSYTEERINLYKKMNSSGKNPCARKVSLTYPDGTVLFFDCVKDCFTYLGYKVYNSNYINKPIAKRGNCLIQYID